MSTDGGGAGHRERPARPPDMETSIKKLQGQTSTID